MKDKKYLQKNVVLDAILLSITIILVTCAIPLTTIFNAPIAVIYLTIGLSVLMVATFIFAAWYNSIIISFDGISLRKRRQRKIIPWRDILDMEIKVFHSKAIIAEYIFKMKDQTICIKNTPYMLDTLLEYCTDDERLKVILQQRHKELQAKLGW